jgi:hypothetical protein
MASSNPHESDEHQDVGSRAGDGLSDALSRLSEHHIPYALRVVAFWTAVVLPFVAVFVLLGGLESTTDWLLFGALLASNVVSLYVGHPHNGE